jgi:peroxiredoxin
MRSIALALLLLPAVAGAYEIGDPVDDIVLADLAGDPVALSDHLGQVIVLNFFTTWCPGCNEEAEVLEQDIWQVYQEDDVVVIAINIQEPVGLVSGWAQAQGVTYPIWMSPDWDVLEPFTSSPALPYNTVIDREMTLRYAQIGFDRDEVIGMVEEILAGSTPVERTTWSAVKGLIAR